MSTDIQSRLADIKARIAKASQEEARNDVLRERAQAEQEEAQNLLREEFGISSVDQAISLRAEFEEKLLEKVAATEKSLDDLGA